MSTPSYPEFFRRCTGHAPYPWQAALAEGAWPELIDVPTGLGKTAAVLVAWLWRRQRAPEVTPRRLVYCLPMRTLVTQTAQAAEAIAARLGEDAPTVHTIMGGEVDETWAEAPERPAIVIGTQDLLVSRALNRGYAMSRYAWPIHFGALNNDALWVFDETQLMGVSVETSAQLQGLRDALGTAAPTHSIWMSATLGRDRLATFDHAPPEDGWRVQMLGSLDLDQARVLARTNARKRLARLEIVVDKEADAGIASELAAAVLERHESDTLTLVVVNRVDRARLIYEALLKAGRDPRTTALVHSRFRPCDRQRNEAVLLEQEGDRIVVATQAVEAGVDVSACTLITELCPWSSFVQRVGRCNRYGELDEGRVFWIDIDTSGSQAKKTVLPYTGEALDAARDVLATLDDCGPAALAQVAMPAGRPTVRPVLRRRDLLELFDTSADLAGDDLDVSRFVRDEDDTDVQCFWRVVNDENAPLDQQPAPARDELCRVSIGAARDFVGRSNHPAWVWDALEREWSRLDARRLRPGQVVMLPVEAAGYDPALGWTGDRKGDPVPEHRPADVPPEAMDDDRRSGNRSWLSLTVHLADVVAATEALTAALALDDTLAGALHTAAAWHDVGKAMPQFQERLTKPVEGDARLGAPAQGGPWAKSSHSRRLRNPSRRYLRHELASALAWLQAGDGGEHEDLIAFLIAGHHGKVRMAIRSLPGEQGPDDGGLFARGVWHGDVLPSVTLPDGGQVPELELDLRVMGLGPGCWLERMLGLRDDPALGPFRLAWLESVLRIADHRASARPSLSTDNPGGAR